MSLCMLIIATVPSQAEIKRHKETQKVNDPARVQFPSCFLSLEPKGLQRDHLKKSLTSGGAFSKLVKDIPAVKTPASVLDHAILDP